MRTTSQDGALAVLRRDKSGNVLALTALSLVPLIGMIGSGLDMARIYASRTRLQHACDAAVLAGRQSMTGNVWAPENVTIANSFFNNNFPAGKYDSKSLNISYLASTDGKVTGNASLSMPMTMMKFFGISDKPIAVSCEAELHLPNTDVMFVLDTTGSMSETNPGDSANRLMTMKSSITSFYNSLEAAKSSGSVVRYGFVPYSESVNVGYLLKANWMAASATYQSRVADGVTQTTTTTPGGTTTQTDTTPWVKQSGSNSQTTNDLPLENCFAPANTYKSNTATLSTTSTPYQGPPAGTKTVKEVERTQNGNQYSIYQTPTQCKLTTTVWDQYKDRRTETSYPRDYPPVTTTRNDYWWKYQPVAYDVSALRGLTSGGSISALIGNGHTSRSIPWNGCIEEAATVGAANYDTIPSGAKDMNIDLIPSDPSTQWKPALAKLVFARSSMTNWLLPMQRTTSNWTNIGDVNSTSNAICPAAARKLATMTSSDLTTYLNTLVASGQTYHDIGMLWGARMLSPTGIFSADNATTSSGGQISRHLIFMTDGDTDTEVDHYDAYGWPALDRRRQVDVNTTPTKAAQDAMVAQRLAALCTATKGKNITVWVIAFGTTLTSNLSDCASPNRAYQASNAASLNATFANIAAQIAQLRLVK